ncbi:hypothetical protein B9Z55_011604 [Caenorhabditis nigoni]|uniref:Tyrosine-protein kinase n=1 Tax=Caenorhabditis nigoni TaxID=1611254 RepID=A0A2G5UKW3_9PELO|nr:hypothetical protein B9Z55_011604 [Caenorhabditis nigoni]
MTRQQSTDQNSCQTAEAIGKRDSRTNLEIDGVVDGTEGAGNTTDLERSGSCPDLAHGVEKPDDEYIRTSLLSYPWYHGVLFGRVTEKLLKWENSYLVRRSILKTDKFLCISARVDNKVSHFPLNCNIEGWSCAKLFERFPAMPNKRYHHIWQLLDAWSLVVNYIVPVRRNKLVVLHSQILPDSVPLGHGAFGEVFKGKFVPIGGTEPTEVAVKRMLGDPKRINCQEFCQEASIMAMLEHRNVVNLFGFAALQFPMMIVMEFVPMGDLKKYLRQASNISPKQISLFALDIANGMRHLASRKVIHRDLACRNCLITKEVRVKISDYGLSVNDVEVVVKNLRKAPIRWLAPETLNKGIFNEKTDVWSYGVLLTELMTRCAADPLAPRDLKEVQKWIKEADHPHRIDGGDPRDFAEMVDYCCEKSPSARPTFQIVKKKVQAIYQKYADLELAHCLSPNPNQSPNVEKKKSEDRKSNTDRRGNNTDRRASTTNLTRKKSRDGGGGAGGMGTARRRGDKTNERKSKGSHTGGNDKNDKGGTMKRMQSARKKDKGGAAGAPVQGPAPAPAK